MHKIRSLCVSKELDYWSLYRGLKEHTLFLFLAVLLSWLMTTATSATQSLSGKQTCGLISGSSTLPGVSLIVTSKRCSFSQAEMRKGIRIDYEVVIDREIRDVVALPQDMTGCQKPGRSGLITFRVIRGEGYSFCPQCDMGLCRKPPTRESITLQPGRYAENIQWNGRTFIGNGEGMSTIQPTEFPPGAYVLHISARGHRQTAAKRAVNSSSQFTVTLDYRITITANSKQEQQINSGGASI